MNGRLKLAVPDIYGCSPLTLDPSSEPTFLLIERSPATVKDIKSYTNTAVAEVSEGTPLRRALPLPLVACAMGANTVLWCLAPCQSLCTFDQKVRIAQEAGASLVSPL